MLSSLSSEPIVFRLYRFIVGKVFDFQPDKIWMDFREYEICSTFAHINLRLSPSICEMTWIWLRLQFTEYGIEGVVPLELLPPDVRSKYQAKPSDRSKRAKKEETKSTANQAEENQVPCAVKWFYLDLDGKQFSFFFNEVDEPSNY